MLKPVMITVEEISQEDCTKQIQKVRKIHDMSQIQVADAMGVKATPYHNREKNLTKWRQREIDKFNFALKALGFEEQIVPKVRKRKQLDCVASGKKMRQYRYKKNLSVREVAQFLGYKYLQSIYLIENGKQQFSQKLFARYVEAVDTLAEENKAEE